MNAMSFDTHTIARRYKAAGVTDDQVEAMVETARETASLPDLSHLATKADLADLRSGISDMRADMKAFFTEARAETSSLRSELKNTEASLRQTISDAKVQMLLATLAIVGFVDGVFFFLTRR